MDDDNEGEEEKKEKEGWINFIVYVSEEFKE